MDICHGNKYRRLIRFRNSILCSVMCYMTLFWRDENVNEPSDSVKWRGISLPSEWRLPPQGRLCSVEVKINLSLCLTKYHAIEIYPVPNGAPCHDDVLRSEGTAPCILNLESRWRWAISFTPQQLYPWERAPDSHWTGGWEDPRDGLDAVTKRKILPGIENRS